MSEVPLYPHPTERRILARVFLLELSRIDSDRFPILLNKKGFLQCLTGRLCVGCRVQGAGSEVQGVGLRVGGWGLMVCGRR